MISKLFFIGIRLMALGLASGAADHDSRRH